MIKIKLFFIRNYQRIIRFLISFSVIGCLATAFFSASAASVSYSFPFSQPVVNESSCFVEIVNDQGFPFIVYVKVAYSAQTPQPTAVKFRAGVDGESFYISYTSNYYSGSSDIGDITVTGYSLYSNGSYAQLAYEPNVARAAIWLGSGRSIRGIHGYNCDFTGVSSSNSDFTFVYGNDNTLNDKMDKIIAAIESNKSSAEKSDYNGVSADQKTAQADLDKAEASINADTATARTDTINLFKTFSIVGDIAKGMLAVTNIFNILTDYLVFAPALLNFALAVGAAAFLLGLSAIILKVVHFKQ